MTEPRLHRVLHVASGLGIGGAELVLARLIESTSDRFEHRVVSLTVGGAVLHRLRREGFQCDEIHTTLRTLPRSVSRLRELITQWRPVTVHGWMYHGNVALALARRLDGPRMIWGVRTVASPSHERVGTAAAIFAGAALASRANCIVYNSAAAARSHERIGYPESRARVIHNGVDMARFRPDVPAGRAWRATHGIAADANVLLIPARLHPVKGHEFLLNILAAVPQSRGWTVVFVGRDDGVNREQLLALARREGVDLRVIAETGVVEDALNAADLVSLPSRWGESFPNAIAEAMACAKPVIASDLGDVAVLIDSTGWIVPAKDAAAWRAQLAAALGETVAARTALGVAARERIAQHFPLTGMHDRYAALFRGDS